jgi:hypothetical protein
MIVNTIRCPTSSMRATMRRFDCAARSCPWLMQIDRSLCMKHVIASTTHPQLARCVGESPRELAGNTRGGCCGRGCGFARWWLGPGRPTAHPNGRGARDGSKVAIRVHAPEPLRRARSVVESMSMAGSRAGIARRLTCYSPRSMSLSSRNGSALGRAEASCRIAS